MNVTDLFSILKDDEKEEIYQLSKKYHENKIQEESKKNMPIVRIKDYGFQYYFDGEDSSVIGYINTKAFEKDYISDFFRRHKYADNVLLIPSGNKKSLKYVIDIFRDMNFKVEKNRQESKILLKRKI